MEIVQARRIKYGIGATLTLGALAIYVLTLCPVAFPGESSVFIVEVLGLVPFPATSHAIWGWVVAAVAKMPMGSIVGRMNLFSSICGALALWFIYLLNASGRYWGDSQRLVFWEPVVRGAAACGYLIFMVPFWYAATRTHFLTFDVLLLAFSLWLLASFNRSHKTWELYLFGFAYGVGIVESTAFVIAAIPVGLIALAIIWRTGPGWVRSIVGLLLFGVLGLLVYLPAAWQYSQTQAYQWREYETFFQILWYMWRDHWLLIKALVLQRGWLLFVLACFAPWMLTAAIATGKLLRNERGIPAILWHALILIWSLLVVFNTPAAPAERLGLGKLVLAPYLFSSAAFGYVVGWFYWLFLGPEVEFEPRRRKVAAGTTVFLLCFLIAAACVNSWAVERDGPRAVQRYVDELLEEVEGREWLASNGFLDEIITLTAHEKGQDIKLISLSHGQLEPYRKYLATQIDSPRLQSLVQIGLLPFFREWARTDEDFGKKLAVHAVPNVWTVTGFVPIASKMVYFGAKDLDEIDLQEVLAANRRFWADTVPDLVAARDHSKLIRPLARGICQHVSRLANDLGILFENAGDHASASEAYKTAREINMLNASALLNLHNMLLETGEDMEEFTHLEDELDNLLNHPMNRVPLPLLVDMHGHIRSPNSLRRLQEVWGMIRERTSAPDPEFEAAFRMYYAGRVGEAKDAVLRILEKRPDHDRAWVLRGLIAHNENDVEELERCIAYMHAQEKEWLPLLIIGAQRALMAGDQQKAKQYYRRILAQRPGDVASLQALLIMAIGEGNDEDMAFCVERLITIDPDNLWANLALGLQQSEEGDFELAETSYRKSLEKYDSPYALNNLAWILQEKGEYQEALRMAKRGIAANKSLYAIWDTLGVILMKMGYPDRALVSLDQAIKLNPGGIDPKIHRLQALIGTEDWKSAREQIEEITVPGSELREDQTEAINAARATLGME
ncbi:MAG: tetratricopeptide repeat protein [Verrucomicrobia bacterium]|nr:tetratricopeptide repeat protein [Verrucomicrobiota bacterium]